MEPIARTKWLNRTVRTRVKWRTQIMSTRANACEREIDFLCGAAETEKLEAIAARIKFTYADFIYLML